MCSSFPLQLTGFTMHPKLTSDAFLVTEFYCLFFCFFKGVFAFGNGLHEIGTVLTCKGTAVLCKSCESNLFLL